MVASDAKADTSTAATDQKKSEMSQSESDADKEQTDREEDEEDDDEEDAEGDADEDDEGDDDDDEDDEDEGEEEEEPAPKIELPNRTTRGKRMAKAIAEEEEEADNSFWNQEFFAEEQKDENYQTESEEEDRVDSDFDKSESSDDDEDGEEKVKRVRRPGPKKDQLPGYKQAALRAARKAAMLRARSEKDKKRKVDGEEAPSAGDSGAGEKPAKRVRIADPEEVAKAPTLRRSTYRRVLDDEMKRRQEENNRTTRKRTERPDEQPPLEAAMVLEDAVTTEFLNQQSLQILLAQEEETKAKANLTKQRASGPRVRWVSSREGDAASSHVLLLEIAPSALPTGLRREVQPPAPTSAFVVDRLGELRPRTSRRPANAGASDSSAWGGGRQLPLRPSLRLLTGEDVSDVKGFGDLRALPWGGAVVEPEVRPPPGFGSNGLDDHGGLAAMASASHFANLPPGEGIGIDSAGRGGAASSSGRGRGRGRGRGAKRGPGRPPKAQPPPEPQPYPQYPSPQFPMGYMAGNNLSPMMHPGHMPMSTLPGLPADLSVGGNAYFKPYHAMHAEGANGGFALDMRRAVDQQHFNGGVANAHNRQTDALTSRSMA